MQEYKCRAECPVDVFKVVTKLGERRLETPEEGFTTFRSIRKLDDYLPDVECVVLSNLELADLKQAMVKTHVPDIHVMLETLKPVNDYTGVMKSRWNILEIPNIC